ncbi:TetR/AcrR family transcriptional regulator [Roseibium sp.]|uniref:TetR/AcrR family transcriptional regulator n=1 Tax=Roseibium sp. TaxID=1936156 RepID=UPI003A9823EC
MRTRLSPLQRRIDILDQAGKLIAGKGLAKTEMEDIRQACGLSRGGLYHHFANKRAVLEALVEAEVSELVKELNSKDGSPIPVLLQAGSRHLGASSDLISGLKTLQEKLDYLSSLEIALVAYLSEPLRARLTQYVRPGIDPAHVAELFLTINARINRRELLGEWTDTEAAAFAATSLVALATLLRDPAELDPMIASLRKKAGRQ